MLFKLTFSNKSQFVIFSYTHTEDIKKLISSVSHGSAIIVASYKFRKGWITPLVDEAVITGLKLKELPVGPYTVKHFTKLDKRQGFEFGMEELLDNAFREASAGETYANLPGITGLLTGEEYKPGFDKPAKRTIIRKAHNVEAVAPEEPKKEEIPEPGNIYYTTQKILAMVKEGGKNKAYHTDRKCGMLTKNNGIIVAIAENYDKEGVLGKMKPCKRCKPAEPVVIAPLEDAKKELDGMPDGHDKNQLVQIVELGEGAAKTIQEMKDKIARLEDYATQQENELEKLKHNAEDLGHQLDEERRKMKVDELVRHFEKELIRKANVKDVRDNEIGTLYRTLLWMKERAK